MSFEFNKMTLNRATTNAIAKPNAPILHFYRTTIDDQNAVFLTPGYFNEVASNLEIDDVIYCETTDVKGFASVTSLDPVTLFGF